MSYRAVITGIGLLTPLGNVAKTFFDAALAGYCGIGLVKKFDTGSLPVHIGGEIDFNGEEALSEDLRRETPTVAQWAVLAARKAVTDARLDLSAGDPYSTDIVLGMSISSIESLESTRDLSGSMWPKACSSTPALMNPAAAAIEISRDLRTCGEAINVTSACSSSTSAIGYALRLIQSGNSTCVLTGGADEGVSKLFLGSYGKALSQRADDPGRASRPFERNRDGAVFSDAACILVVEEYESAKRRGAPIYCEIKGFGATNEASSALQITRSEEASAICVQRALRSSKTSVNEIDYYCALGISHPFLDIRETRMLKRVFQEHVKNLSISSIKSMIGHPLGASGALQAACCALSIRNGAIPPTINYEDPDPDCDLDYVPNEARSKKVRQSLIYTLGSGGSNAALVLAAC